MAASTFTHHITNISLFLGHCYWYQQVAQPDMTLYLDPLKVCDYVSTNFVVVLQTEHTAKSKPTFAVVQAEQRKQLLKKA